MCIRDRDRKWRWIRSGVFCAAAERDQFKRSQLQRQWMVGFCICTCAPEIMKSGGGQLDMLAIYLLKVHLLSCIIHTSGVYWFEIDFFSDLILCDKSEKVCLSDSAWKLCNCIVPQCVRHMWIVVIGGKVWCCDTHVLDIWDNFAWLYHSTAPMSGARARHCR